jgi:hypothetical protein
LHDLQTVGGFDGGLLHVTKVLKELILAIGILEELINALGPLIGLIYEIEAENYRVSEDENQEENGHDSTHRQQRLRVFELQRLRLNCLIQIYVEINEHNDIETQQREVSNQAQPKLKLLFVWRQTEHINRVKDLQTQQHAQLSVAVFDPPHEKHDK